MEYTKDGVLERKLKQIESLIVEESLPLTDWETWTGMYAALGAYQLSGEERSCVSPGDSWSCRDHEIRWFQKKVRVPSSFRGKRVVLLLDFGGEALVRVNGEVRSAVTSYQRESPEQRIRVELANPADGGEEFEVLVEAGMNYMEFAPLRNRGMTQAEYRIRQCSLAVVNEETERCYYDFRTAFLAVKALRPAFRLPQTLLPGEWERLAGQGGEDAYFAKRVEAALAQAMALVDFDFSPQQTRESLLRAAAALRGALDGIPRCPHSEITFVGQGHIDTAWRWSIRESARKTAKTFANSLALMDRYPEYVFAFSQPQLFEFVKQQYPQLYERVKRSVKAGQLELVGNTWVEMDANLPSGESLVRQLLYGTQFFENEFGKSSPVFWMPDVFGYSWALPQIIKKSGMKYFYTSKLCNNDTNRFPYTLFQWKGVDGTSVVAYVQRLNYNGNYTPETAATIYRRFDEKGVCDNLLMTYGYGDGGGGPNEEMVETGRRMQDFPGLPKTRFGTAASFFEKTEEIAGELPVWNDEMYFEHHRGTYTSQAFVKKANRKNELLYRSAEWRASLSHALLGEEYPAAELLAGYKMLLTNQFHDILPGSSIHLVYEQARQDYEKIWENGERLRGKATDSLLRLLCGRQGDVAVFNDLSWPRSGVVRVPGAGPSLHAVDCRTGEAAETVFSGGSLYFFAENVPPMGACCYRLAPGAPAAAERKEPSPGRLENEFLRLSFDSEGSLISVYDKESGREALAAGEHPASLLVFEDKPANETAWNLDLEYQNKCWRLAPQEAELVESTSLRSVMRVTYAFHQSKIVQDVILEKKSRRVDFHLHVDWQETEKVLKAEFLTDVLSSRAAYEIQFGAIERPTHWNLPQDKARFEVCGHKWADLSEGDYGVSLLNDCKYGYDIHGSRMRLTLLRSAVDPDPLADRGEHEFTYSLYPHRHVWQLAETVNEGFSLNVPLEAVPCREDASGEIPAASWFSCAPKNVILDTVKRAEDGDGLILRFYESSGTKTQASLQAALPLASAEECSLMEREGVPCALEEGGLRFSINPFEIKTFRIRFR